MNKFLPTLLFCSAVVLTILLGWRGFSSKRPAQPLPEHADPSPSLRHEENFKTDGDTADLADLEKPESTAEITNPSESALMAERQCLALAETDPREALILAIETGLIDEKKGLLENLTAQWATQEPGEALEWAKQEEDIAYRDRLLARVAFAAAPDDPEAAASIVANDMTPGPRQAEAAMSVLHQWSLRDPAAATAWVATFQEGALRERAMQEIESIRNYCMARSDQQ